MCVHCISCAMVACHGFKAFEEVRKVCLVYLFAYKPCLKSCKLHLPRQFECTSCASQGAGRLPLSELLLLSAMPLALATK